MNSKAPYKIILVALAIIFIVCSLLWTQMSINRKEEKIISNIQSESFNKTHFNYIVLDTFVSLLHKAYNTTVQTKTIQNKLHVSIENAGAITKDFFNGNDLILSLDENDFGFDINYNESANKIEASFMIQENAVPVPNDVMIKLIDKNYN